MDAAPAIEALGADFSIPALMGRKADAQKDVQAKEKVYTDIAAKKSGEMGTVQEKLNTAAPAPEIPALDPIKEFKATQIPPEQAKEAFSSFMAFAMIGGMLSRQPMLAAMNNMTAAMKGWHEGDQERVKNEMNEFDRNFKVAQTNNSEKIAAYKLASEKHRGDIQGLMDEMKILSMKYEDPMKAALADKGDAKELIRSIDHDINASLKAKESADKMSQQWKMMEQHLSAQAAMQDKRLGAQEHRADERATKAEGQKFTQQNFIAQRSVNALGGVASILESIVQLPEGSTTGWLPNLQTKDGMINAVRNQFGRKITDVDADMMNTFFAGIGRNLATIEASGTATGLTALSQKLESGIYINAGVDDPYKVAAKLADIRRVASENIRPAIESGAMPPQQAEVARKLVERIETAIPYTTLDVVKAYRAAQNPDGKSIKDATEDVVKPTKKGERVQISPGVFVTKH